MFKRIPANLKGILLGLIGYSAFACSDAGAKWLTPHYNVHQIIMLVQIFAGSLLLLFSLRFAHFMGPITSLFDQAAKENAKTHLVRGILNASINMLIIYAFIELPLSTVYTSVFSKPFFAALLGLILFAQPIGLHRFIAILIGFSGILIAFQPWTQSFPLHLSLILIALPMIIALFFIAARWLREEGSILAMAFWPILASMSANIPLAIINWQTPDLMHLPIFALTGLFCASGVVTVSRAFQIAQPAAVAPMLYIEMLWGLALGYILFSDIANAHMLVGSTIIIAGGIYLMWREHQAETKTTVATTPASVSPRSPNAS